jgi:putative flippase GtrA
MKLKTFAQLLIKNTITQIIVLGVIVMISSILTNYFDWAYYVMTTSLGLLALIALVFIVFAWVINPIREYLKNKK